MQVLERKPMQISNETALCEAVQLLGTMIYSTRSPSERLFIKKIQLRVLWVLLSDPFLASPKRHQYESLRQAVQHDLGHQ